MEDKSYSYGIYLKILHCLVFTVMNFLILYYSFNYPLPQILFLRLFFGSLIAVALTKILKIDIFKKISIVTFGYYTLRAIISFLAMFLWVDSMKILGVSETTIFSYLTPLWLIFSAMLFFGEKLSKKHLIIIILNFIGVTLALNPKIDIANYYGLLEALLSSILWALYDSICKKQASTENYLAQCFYTFSISAILSIPLALYYWKDLAISDLGGIIIISFFAVANVILLFSAFKFAPILVLIPFSYFRIIFSVLIAYFFLAITPSFETLIGMIIIFCADLYFYIDQKKVLINN